MNHKKTALAHNLRSRSRREQHNKVGSSMLKDEEEQNSAMNVMVVADGDSMTVRKEDGFPT